MTYAILLWYFDLLNMLHFGWMAIPVFLLRVNYQGTQVAKKKLHCFQMGSFMCEYGELVALCVLCYFFSVSLFKFPLLAILDLLKIEHPQS